ncbi:MAG: hypothetical protein P1V51_23625 [Deltaproteobacteria bacterium]|nr:hypothetical protein [Deltaproteobacteria bacterium]
MSASQHDPETRAPPGVAQSHLRRTIAPLIAVVVGVAVIVWIGLLPPPP